MGQGHGIEDFDPAICEERHKSISFRVTVIIWLIGIFLAASGVAITYMTMAYAKAQDAAAKLELLRLEASTHKNEAATESQRVNAEIERAKIRADERLANAIEKVGYEQKAMRTDIMYKLDRVAEDVAELKETPTNGVHQ